MKPDLATLSILSSGLLFGAATLLEAQTPSNCAPRDQVVERLATLYGETRQSIGLASNNAMIEVFASLDSGTWTITVTTENGIACLVASGQAFKTVANALSPNERDT